jgi:hypothetical protein
MYKTPNSRSDTEFPIYIVRIRIGVVNIMTRLWPGQSGVLFPARETDFPKILAND